MTNFGQIPSNDELITGTNVTLGGLNLASLYPDPGVDKPASLKVTQRGAGANMSVDVAAGSAYVPDGSSGINLISKASVTNVAVANGDGSGIRHDFVTIDSSGTVSVIQGSVGTDPTPATNTHVLARIRVPQSESTSIDDADIDDKREYGTVFRRPRGLLGSDENQSVSGISARTTTASVSVTAEDDRRVKLLGHLVASTSDGSTHVRVWLREDSNLLQRANLGAPGNTSTTDRGSSIVHIYTPGVGTYSFSVSVERTAGSGTIDATGDVFVEDAGGLDQPTGSEGQ